MQSTNKKILLQMFPQELANDVIQVFNILPDKNNRWVSDHFQVVQMENQTLKIPTRIYINQPTGIDEISLSEIQKTILNCIFLRHHNGFIRQKRLRKLLMNNEFFITPYTFQLLGESVIEILFDLNMHINDNTIHNYAYFITQNPTYFRLTENRVISYWDEYYRQRYWKFTSYIGKQLIDRLKEAVEKN
ncbi:hypothetical protein [Solitalea canadensis]|uniref:Uncharacterized protein n=1 Tax=Solitalea canadensis (strain ATCC 29591 / DSM 3403 / JCM 21819 / LMG 8368 / NBRC 15130 / NCIMB 12057 / USAM 9D) TaxID=929556 RepID=H8KLI7_SOLCM|nr:hypothetical protein [Solitalea canadensis]AFD08874.1 hypothetical protein Solca_3877 [Solitalea canadensis DSM 3403]